eukprot:TRINITY_DN6129_c0_g1_i7.p1 TRINITY_DN6129_c0_g1~~TRINITY_DN6129_c0_g1_i7.p1  ORF type:complete len:1436 (-),score=280.86 TRINITY_DN6129_c0_g1_i7:20-4327(-)
MMTMHDLVRVGTVCLMVTTMLLLLMMMCGRSASAAQIDVLLDLYVATNGDQWLFCTSEKWNSTADVCQWSGIECDTQTGLVVTEIDLSGCFGARGTYIPASLAQLTSLTRLDLSSSSMIGATLPPELSLLSNLEYLDVHGIGLVGTFPPSYGALTNLEYLDIGLNDLEGTIPAEIGNMIALQHLDMQFNTFNGTFPATLVQLINLRYLRFNYHFELTGSLPDALGDLIHLEELIVSTTRLTGTIPNTLGRLINLKNLDLGRNGFSGTIPDVFGACVLLETFDVNFMGLEGTLPTSLGNARGMRNFEVSLNELTGTLLSEYGNWHDLVSFNVGSNQLEGSIPDSYVNFTKINRLGLYDNGFSGTLPERVGNWTTLTSLNIGGNGFSGTLPSSIGNLKRLDILYLSQNQFTGTIPESYGDLPLLTQFQLMSNLLEGTIPAGLGNMPRLDDIMINDNKLNGTIPDTFANYTGYRLYVQNNALSGTIPSFIAERTRIGTLWAVDLSYNKFSGLVPSLFDNASTSLQLNIACNELSNMSLPSKCGIYYRCLPQSCAPIPLQIIASYTTGSDAVVITEGPSRPLSSFYVYLRYDNIQQDIDITIALSVIEENANCANPGEISLSPSSLRFTNLNRGSNQYVTVTAGPPDGQNCQRDRVFRIKSTISSATTFNRDATLDDITVWSNNINWPVIKGVHPSVISKVSSLDTPLTLKGLFLFDNVCPAASSSPTYNCAGQYKPPGLEGPTLRNHTLSIIHPSTNLSIPINDHIIYMNESTILLRPLNFSRLFGNNNIPVESYFTFTFTTPARATTSCPYSGVAMSQRDYQGQAAPECSPQNQLFYTDDKCTSSGVWGSTTCAVCPSMCALCPGGNRVWALGGCWNPDERTEPRGCPLAQACLGSVDYKGVSTCQANYTGDYCAFCAPHFYKMYPDERVSVCLSCFDDVAGDILRAVIVPIIFFGIVMIAIGIFDESRLDSFVACLIALQQLIQIGMSAHDRLPYSANVFINALTPVLFNYNFIRPGCTLGSLSYPYLYAGYIILAIAFMILFALAAILRSYVLFSPRSGSTGSAYVDAFTLIQERQRACMLDTKQGGGGGAGDKQGRVSKIARRAGYRMKGYMYSLLVGPHTSTLDRASFSPSSSSSSPSSSSWRKIGERRILRSWLILACIIHSIFCLKSLQGVHCVDGHLSHEPGVACYVGDHLAVSPFVWLILILFCAGFPLVCLWWTYRVYRRRYEVKMTLIYGFLYRGLRRRMFWFRSTPMIINFAIAAEKVFDLDPLAVGLLNGSLFLVSLAIVLVAWPFRSKADNWIFLFGNIMRMIFILYILHANGVYYTAMFACTGAIILVLGGVRVWLFRRRAARNSRSRKSVPLETITEEETNKTKPAPDADLEDDSNNNNINNNTIVVHEDDDEEEDEDIKVAIVLYIVVWYEFLIQDGGCRG